MATNYYSIRVSFGVVSTTVHTDYSVILPIGIGRHNNVGPDGVLEDELNNATIQSSHYEEMHPSD